MSPLQLYQSEDRLLAGGRNRCARLEGILRGGDSLEGLRHGEAAAANCNADQERDTDDSHPHVRHNVPRAWASQEDVGSRVRVCAKDPRSLVQLLRQSRQAGRIRPSWAVGCGVVGSRQLGSARPARWRARRGRRGSDTTLPGRRGGTTAAGARPKQRSAGPPWSRRADEPARQGQRDQPGGDGNPQLEAAPDERDGKARHGQQPWHDPNANLQIRPPLDSTKFQYTSGRQHVEVALRCVQLLRTDESYSRLLVPELAEEDCEDGTLGLIFTHRSESTDYALNKQVVDQLAASSWSWAFRMRCISGLERACRARHGRPPRCGSTANRSNCYPRWTLPANSRCERATGDAGARSYRERHAAIEQGAYLPEAQDAQSLPEA